jgi:hypothetical protein
MIQFNEKEYLDFMDSWKKERKYEPFCLDGLLDDIETISHNLSKTKDMLLLGYYHLSYVLSYEEEFDNLVNIIRKYFN